MTSLSHLGACRLASWFFILESGLGCVCGHSDLERRCGWVLLISLEALALARLPLKKTVDQVRGFAHAVARSFLILYSSDAPRRRQTARTESATG